MLVETRYLDAAEHTVKAAWASLNSMPHVHGALLHALEEMLFGLDVVVVRSDTPELWQSVARQSYQPRRIYLCIEKDTNNLPAALAAKSAAATDCAYLCRGFRCSPPLDSPQALLQALATE
jgi:hypothetical protein